MFGSFGAPELIIIAVVVILLFGIGKISGLGKELGSSIKEFRKAVKDEDEEKAKAEAEAAPVQQPPVYQQQLPPQPQQPPQQYAPPPQQYAPPAQPYQNGAPQQQPPQQPVAPQGDSKNLF